MPPDRISELRPLDRVLLRDTLDVRLDVSVDVKPEELLDRRVRDRVGRLIDRAIDLDVVLAPGKIGNEPAVVDASTLAKLAKELATADGNQVVWTSGLDEVLVHLASTQVGLGDGTVGVSMLLETEQTGKVPVSTVFAVGNATRETGMVMTTLDRPVGPAALVERWGEAVIAASWDLLLRIVVVVASRSGKTSTGQTLRPAGLRATPAQLEVVVRAERSTR